MPSTSRASRRRNRKLKSVPKPKQEWRVKQPQKNWLDLPSDLMVNIIQRIGAFDILENAQKVCTAWREACKDPAMWKVICLDRSLAPSEYFGWREMCMNAVDRSQGQLVDLTTIGHWDCEILQYAADRSSQLRRLEIISYLYGMSGSWSEPLKRLSLLEELSLSGTKLSDKDIETVGHHCPMLKKVKMELYDASLWYDNTDDILSVIGKNLPELTHLEFVGIPIEDYGVQAILDGCCHLESLDLRHCTDVDIRGDLRKRCSQQIKDLKLPENRHENRRGGYPRAYSGIDIFDDKYDGCLFFEDEIDDEYYAEFDEDRNFFDENGDLHFEDLNDYMAYKHQMGF